MADKKPDAKDAAPAADKAAGAATDKASGSGKSSGLKAWLPAIVAIVLAPAASFGVAQFVLLPKIQKQIAAAVPPAAAQSGGDAGDAQSGGDAEGGQEGGAHGGKEGAPVAGNYEFSNVVVNLAGTMGTRYLKTSFIVTPVDKKGNIKVLFEEQKAKLTDITLNVLSSLSLSDLEEPGAKNILREKLVATYNQALGKRVVDQVYFSDFVVQ